MLTLAEQDAIRRLAADVPAIWHAATTTDAERKGILRQILDKVVIQIEGQSEWIEARLHWAGGHETYTRFRRPVAKLTQLSEWPELHQHILAFKAEGRTAREIAEQLNREGRTSPHLKPFTASTIRTALSRRGLTNIRRGTSEEPVTLAEGERFASDLARELGVRPQVVYAWIKSGRVPGRQLDGTQGRWIVRADASVMATLKASEEGPTGQKTVTESRTCDTRCSVSNRRRNNTLLVSVAEVVCRQALAGFESLLVGLQRSQLSSNFPVRSHSGVAKY